jgi:hypothetical protein
MSEIGYIIDCSFELLESTPDVYESFDFALFNHGYDIESLYHKNPSMDTLDIMSMASKDIDSLRNKHFSSMENMIVSLKSLSSFPGQYHIFKENLLDKLIQSHISSAYQLKKPRLFSFVNSVENTLPDIYHENDIIHPFNIYECIQSNNNLSNWHKRVRNSFFTNLSYINNDSLNEVVQDYLHYEKNKLNNFKIDYNNSIENLTPKEDKRKKKQARNAIKRALNLFSSFFGEEKIKAFLNGGSFSVEGKYFNYIIKRSNTSIISHTQDPFSGHIPYSLEIADKKSNLVIGNLCVTISKTPVIDQIIAILFHLKTNEEEVLQKANLFQIRIPFDELENEYVHQFFTKPKTFQTSEKYRSCYNNIKQNLILKHKKRVYQMIDNLFQKDLSFSETMISHCNKPLFYFDQLVENIKNNQVGSEQQKLIHLLGE